MARLIPLLVAILLLAGGLALGLGLPTPATAAQAAGGRLPQNDAGSGGDAGDTPEAALALTTPRRIWSANLTPTGTDSDWYRLAASQAFCASVEATVNSPGFLTLTNGVGRHAAAEREVMPHHATRLFLAGEAGQAPYFGVEPPMMNHLSLGDSTGSPPSPGRYTFAFTASPYAELDPEGDGEAPEAGATPATSAPLPRGCSAGRLDPSRGDLEDRYHLDVAEGGLTTVSFAVASGDAAKLRITMPSGETYATVPSGGAVEIYAYETGRWTLSVVPMDDSLPVLGGLGLALPRADARDLVETSYLLGTTDGPPGDTQPCRPSCLG